MRINKFLSHAGLGSRRKVEEFVLSGRIRVNGTVVRSLNARIDPDGDMAEFDGRRIVIEKYLYIILNKPRGIITTVEDERDRRTVMDLIPERFKRAGVVPVGRLDKDSEGLLLLTNDGELAYVLTHPRYGIIKEYITDLDRPLEERDRVSLEKGVRIEGKRTNPSDINRLDEHGRRVLIKISEGKKRQIRRMFEQKNYRVLKLKRISFGPLVLKGIHSGDFRSLKKGELAQLKKIVQSAVIGNNEAQVKFR